MIKIGDLVKYVGPPGLEFSPHKGRTGIVLKVDSSYHGANYAFKRRLCPRDDAVLDTRKPDFIGPTKGGIRDRILVLWGDDNHLEYVTSDDVEGMSGLMRWAVDE